MSSTPAAPTPEERAHRVMVSMLGDFDWTRDPGTKIIAEEIRAAVADERDALLSILRAVEWRGCGCSYPEAAACPCCRGEEPLTGRDPRPPYEGHRPDCALAAAIRPTP